MKKPVRACRRNRDPFGRCDNYARSTSTVVTFESCVNTELTDGDVEESDEKHVHNLQTPLYSKSIAFVEETGVFSSRSNFWPRLTTFDHSSSFFLLSDTRSRNEQIMYTSNSIWKIFDAKHTESLTFSSLWARHVTRFFEGGKGGVHKNTQLFNFSYLFLFIIFSHYILLSLLNSSFFEFHKHEVQGYRKTSFLKISLLESLIKRKILENYNWASIFDVHSSTHE